MKKLILFLVLALAFTCCAETLSPENDPSVVAVFDGGCVYFDEVFEDYDTATAVYSALYGDDEASRADVVQNIGIEIINSVIKHKLLMQYAESLDTPLLSAEDYAEIETRAMRDYKLLYQESLSIYMADEGVSEEEARNELSNDLREAGISYENYLASYTDEFLTRAAIASLAGDVKVTNSQVSVYYNDKLAKDTAYFTEYPEDYPYAYFYTDGTELFVPEGLRKIRLWYVDMTPDDMSAKLSSGSMKEIMRYATSAEHIYGEPGGEDGAPVYPGCALFNEEIISAAYSLREAGDLSQPISIDGGYVIVEYEGNLKSGTIDQKSVYTEIYNMVLDEVLAQKGNEKLQEMLGGISITYYLYRLG